MPNLTIIDVISIIEREGIEGDIPSIPSSPSDLMALLLPWVGQPINLIPKYLLLALQGEPNGNATATTLCGRLADEPLWTPNGEEVFI